MELPHSKLQTFYQTQNLKSFSLGWIYFTCQRNFMWNLRASIINSCVIWFPKRLWKIVFLKLLLQVDTLGGWHTKLHYESLSRQKKNYCLQVLFMVNIPFVLFADTLPTVWSNKFPKIKLCIQFGCWYLWKASVKLSFIPYKNIRILYTIVKRCCLWGNTDCKALKLHKQQMTWVLFTEANRLTSLKGVTGVTFL